MDTINGNFQKIKRRSRLLCLAASALVLSSNIAQARDFVKPAEGRINETPVELKKAGIDPHPGDKIDLNLSFKDHNGQSVKLKDLVADGKPLLLSLAYFSCPSLCNFHMNGLNDAFKELKEPLGTEFRVVTLSFDPREKPELAALKRQNYLKAYNRPAGNDGWIFLTGEQPEIDQITRAIGFNYNWDETQKQWAHASAAYAISPDGTISRYLFGIQFDPKTLRLSMLEASKGKVGNVIDKLILFCFHYDPQQSKYSIAAMNVMRLGGFLILIVMGLYFLPHWLRRNQSGKVKIGIGIK